MEDFKCLADCSYRFREDTDHHVAYRTGEGFLLLLAEPFGTGAEVKTPGGARNRLTPVLEAMGFGDRPFLLDEATPVFEGVGFWRIEIPLHIDEVVYGPLLRGSVSSLDEED